jgi:hypothetical protein
MRSVEQQDMKKLREMVQHKMREIVQICPKCGEECDRDSVHNGVGMMYGPWGCMCGWSEWDEYDSSNGEPCLAAKETGYYVNSMGNLFPTIKIV